MKFRLVIISLLISSITLANEPLVTLPFKLHRGHIYVQGKINGSRRINMLFDTGAGGNVISEKVAKEIGMKMSGAQVVNGVNGTVTLKSSEKNSLSLGPKLKVRQQTFFFLDMDELSDEDLPLEAIIGANILSEYVVSLNFDTNILEIYSQSGYARPNDYTQHQMQLDEYGIPVINGSLSTTKNDIKNGSFLIDTGAALAISANTPFVKTNSLIQQVSPNYAYESKGIGADAIEYVGRLKGFEVLDQSFEGVPIRMSTVTRGVSGDENVSGIIGSALLKRFNLIFDYSNGKLYTKKNRHFDKPFWDNRCGLRIAKKKGALKVMTVVPNSAADKAGIQVGDGITSVDGLKKLSSDGFDEYIFKATKTISIQLKRGTRTIRVQLLPYSMI